MCKIEVTKFQDYVNIISKIVNISNYDKIINKNPIINMIMNI